MYYTTYKNANGTLCHAYLRSGFTSMTIRNGKGGFIEVPCHSKYIALPKNKRKHY
jgi:hypothetical protein